MIDTDLIKSIHKDQSRFREIVRGRGAPGLSNFRAIALDTLKEADKLVDRYKTQHPDYVVAVLAALTFNNGALRATVAGTPFGPQRAENFCAWHLALAFGGADPKAATIAGVQEVLKTWDDSKTVLTAFTGHGLKWNKPV